jgi:hypothetical protein
MQCGLLWYEAVQEEAFFRVVERVQDEKLERSARFVPAA